MLGPHNILTWERLLCLPPSHQQLSYNLVMAKKLQNVCMYTTFNIVPSIYDIKLPHLEQIATQGFLMDSSLFGLYKHLYIESPKIQAQERGQNEVPLHTSHNRHNLLFFSVEIVIHFLVAA